MLAVKVKYMIIFNNKGFRLTVLYYCYLILSHQEGKHLYSSETLIIIVKVKGFFNF